jgi:hypothetical protein
MTKRKRPLELPKPGPQPVTSADVAEWFASADVASAGEDAAASFAVVVEGYRRSNQWARTNLADSASDDVAIRRVRQDAATLMRSLIKLWKAPRRPAPSPELITLTIALQSFCQESPGVPNRRPTNRRTLQLLVLHGALRPLLPGATVTAKRKILRAAIRRIGWKDMASSEIGRLLRRPGRDPGEARGEKIVAALHRSG